ncbi:putative RING-H2 finger protein ATL35 [Capsella rubella]|uniref:putative RING-H2 finger protein ATL35 n=1 Tax=Capsella rubella TaxID=81985 RepID=UPI000CD4FDE5|nr:putative RING-H2 finger protein ATL35 [Capsella rubella]
MNTFRIHGTVASILFSLIIFHFLPYVTCQQALEYVSPYPYKTRKFDTESIIVIVLVVTFMSLIMVFACCCNNTSSSAEIDAASLLNNRAMRGLEKEVIESFPSFLYSEVKRVKIGKGGVECAICLSDFEDQERLRWLPPCSHTFHANCIDVWLSSRSTCPVCRAILSLEQGENSTYPSMDVEEGNAQRGGHSLVQLCENLERFTLQLPEEVQRQFISLNLVRKSHMALPQAMSSRQRYRSGSERGGFSSGRQRIHRDLSFSFQAASVQITHERNDQVVETSQDKDNNLGERSFERLMPEKV